MDFMIPAVRGAPDVKNSSKPKYLPTVAPWNIDNVSENVIEIIDLNHTYVW